MNVLLMKNIFLAIGQSPYSLLVRFWCLVQAKYCPNIGIWGQTFNKCSVQSAFMRIFFVTLGDHGNLYCFFIVYFLKLDEDD